MKVYSQIAKALAGEWDILLTPTRPVPHSWFPEDLRGLPAVGRGPMLYPEVLTGGVGLLDVSAGALAEVALQQLADGVEVGLDALYLRRPDAQPSAGAKSALLPPHGERS